MHICTPTSISVVCEKSVPQNRVMARVRSLRRPKKKPKTVVSPDSFVPAENDVNDNPSDNESEECPERLEFSTDDMRKVRMQVDHIMTADEVTAAVEAAVNPTLIPNNNLFGTSQLYAVAKPIVSNLQSIVKGIMPPGESWGILRTTQLLEHVFTRIRSLFNFTKTNFSENLDTQMIDSAIEYLASLQINHGGTNYKDNEYVRTHVLEALMPTSMKSGRALASRLKVNRNIVPEILAKRLHFNKLVVARDVKGPTIQEETDHVLEESALDFEANRSADELGLSHLFTHLSVSSDDDFFFSSTADEVHAPFLKDKKASNPLHDHLALKIRKQRKDCPKYLDVVRSYGHATFRPDTFAKNKKMVKNEDGTYDFHLFHIQNRSIKDTYESFLQSVIYHDWQYLNRWKKVNSSGESVEVLPTICLRLFYYALCPCCKEPTQRDCADSLVVGFSHALVGMGKIRMSEANDRKNLIRTCTCAYHSREANNDLWRSTEDFMTAMLCAPVEFEEFNNPEISQYSRKVSVPMLTQMLIDDLC